MSTEKKSKNGTDEKKSKASRGGHARREAMSPEERKRVAAQAAAERWAKAKGLPRETHPGTIQIGELRVPCAVLSASDGTVMRVIPRAGLRSAFDVRSRSSSAGSSDNANIPGFLAGPTIARFISAELHEMFSGSIAYRPKKGGSAVIGYAYPAEILALICEAVNEADAAKSLQPSQAPVAAAAKALYKALARVGIIALIDEATGYQADRAKDELQRILQAYIVEEMRPWVEAFPHEFFRQIYRLHGWQYKEGCAKRPGYIGTLINEWVYGRLPPPVLPELRTRNPSINGRRKHKHHSFLTEDTGIPHLDRQLASITTLMRASRTLEQFENMLFDAFPKPGDRYNLPFHDADE